MPGLSTGGASTGVDSHIVHASIIHPSLLLPIQARRWMGKQIACRLVFIVVVLIFAPRWALSQEVYVFGGISGDQHHSSLTSGSWALSYMGEIGNGFVGSFTWLNEGHLGGHHRDGPAFQMWYRYSVNPKLSFEGGGGVYVFYDTKRRKDKTVNTHGLGSAFSLAGTYRLTDRWLLQLRANAINTSQNIDTISAMLGIGYVIGVPGPLSQSPGNDKRTWTYNNELALMAGRTADNSYDHGHHTAVSVEYRRRLSPHLEWTAGWLNESDSSFAARYGPYTQLFAVNDFFDGRFGLGLGLGPYLTRDNRYGEGNTHLSAMLTMAGTYRFSSPWAVRVLWHRVTTHSHSDADILLGGVSYRF